MEKGINLIPHLGEKNVIVLLPTYVTTKNNYLLPQVKAFFVAHCMALFKGRVLRDVFISLLHDFKVVSGPSNGSLKSA